MQESAAAAAKENVPSDLELDSMIDDLQAAVEIWLKPGGKENKGGEAEFLYDESWGGFVNCGCNYTFEEDHAGEGFCSNSFPDCPAIDSVNEDFGNAWLVIIYGIDMTILHMTFLQPLLSTGTMITTFTMDT